MKKQLTESQILDIVERVVQGLLSMLVDTVKEQEGRIALLEKNVPIIDACLEGADRRISDVSDQVCALVDSHETLEKNVLSREPATPDYVIANREKELSAIPSQLAEGRLRRIEADLEALAMRHSSHSAGMDLLASQAAEREKWRIHGPCVFWRHDYTDWKADGKLPAPMASRRYNFTKLGRYCRECGKKQTKLI